MPPWTPAEQQWRTWQVRQILLTGVQQIHITPTSNVLYVASYDLKLFIWLNNLFIFTVLCPPPRTITLTVKNTVEPKSKSFTVGIENNQTLLQVLQCFAQANSEFRCSILCSGIYLGLIRWCNMFAACVTLCSICSFKTIEKPGIGTYLEEVMGFKKGPNQFWDTFLYNETTKDVIPISEYKPKDIVISHKVITNMIFWLLLSVAIVAVWFSTQFCSI